MQIDLYSNARFGLAAENRPLRAFSCFTLSHTEICMDLCNNIILCIMTKRDRAMANLQTKKRVLGEVASSEFLLAQDNSCSPSTCISQARGPTALKPCGLLTHRVAAQVRRHSRCDHLTRGRQRREVPAAHVPDGWGAPGDFR